MKFVVVSNHSPTIRSLQTNQKPASHHRIILMETCNNRNAEKRKWRTNEKKAFGKLFLFTGESRAGIMIFLLMNFSFAIFTNSRANSVYCVCPCVYMREHMLQYSYAIYIHCSIPFRTSKVFSHFILGSGCILDHHMYIYNFQHHRTFGPSNNYI